MLICTVFENVKGKKCKCQSNLKPYSTLLSEPDEAGRWSWGWRSRDLEGESKRTQRFSSSIKKCPSFHRSDWSEALLIFQPRYVEHFEHVSSCIVWAPVAMRWTRGVERITLQVSVNRDAFPEKPRKALDSGGIASKGRREDMDVIAVMHCLQASARGIGGSGLDVGRVCPEGTDGRRRGELGGLCKSNSPRALSLVRSMWTERKRWKVFGPYNVL
jgi:hypothetical protein